jgi:hypothetical protein
MKTHTKQSVPTAGTAETLTDVKRKESIAQPQDCKQDCFAMTCEVLRREGENGNTH